MNKQEALVHLVSSMLANPKIAQFTIQNAKTDEVYLQGYDYHNLVEEAEAIYNEIEKRCQPEEKPEPKNPNPVTLPIAERPDMSILCKEFKDDETVNGVLLFACQCSIIDYTHYAKLCDFFAKNKMLNQNWNILRKLVPQDLYNEPTLDIKQSERFVKWLGLTELLPF